MPEQFKEAREKCYFARDSYWKCLDSNNDQGDKCTKLRKEFEKNCRNTWVVYFDRQRRYQQFKANDYQKTFQAPPELQK